MLAVILTASPKDGSVLSAVTTNLVGVSPSVLEAASIMLTVAVLALPDETGGSFGATIIPPANTLKLVVIGTSGLKIVTVKRSFSSGSPSLITPIDVERDRSSPMMVSVPSVSS